jgi:ribosomal protein S12 methylthiotransferase
MKIGFVSLGCPKNLVDSEVMLGMAEKDGHEITADASGADVLVVNTCAFIDRAKAESIDTILEMAELKKQAAGRKLVVTGCLAERYRDELKKEIPEIDAIYGTGEVEGLAAFMSGVANPQPGGAKALPFYTRPPVFGVDLPTYIYDADTPRKRVTPGHYAYVKIAEGCDYKCAFCIIPKMRGHYRSRSIDSIVKEARQLASQGVKELLLISQDTTFYGIDRGERGALPRLLQALNGVEGIEWIRLLYLYPTTITSEVIDAIADRSVRERAGRTRGCSTTSARAFPTSHSAPPSLSDSPVRPPQTSPSSRPSLRKSDSITSASSPTPMKKAPPPTN